jgi:hypothetical protein
LKLLTLERIVLKSINNSLLSVNGNITGKQFQMLWQFRNNEPFPPNHFISLNLRALKFDWEKLVSRKAHYPQEKALADESVGFQRM